MSKLSIDQKTIEELFSDKKTDFLIPDYQRPYVWEIKECQQLCDDIFAFAFPNDNYESFNNDDEYFFTIVTFKNVNSRKLEVIDHLNVVIESFLFKVWKYEGQKISID